MIHICLFGEFRLVLNHVLVNSINTPRLQSLLAYLILHHDVPQSRQQLAYLFYPDSSEGQARTNLRKLLYFLRQALPDADRFMEMESQTVSWLVRPGFSADLLEFNETLQAARQATGSDPVAERAHLERAVDLYRGDFLSGSYDEWVEPERERLRQQYAATLERLVATLEEQHAYREALQYALRLQKLDALDEGAYRHLMRLYALSGDRASALRVYQNCVTILNRELSAEPSPETQATYAWVNKNFPGAGKSWSGAAPAGSPPAPLPRGRRDMAFPFIGREVEINQLLGEWALAVLGQRRLVFISGAAGIGKTRLVGEFARRAGEAGAQALVGRTEADEPQPYQAILQALRSVQPVDALLARLPGADAAGMHPTGTAAASDKKEVLFEPIAGAVERASQVHPLILILEDLHWAGQATVALLEFLAQRLASCPILILATYREDETTRTHPIRLLRRRLQAGRQVAHIALGRLEEPEVNQLLLRLTRSKGFVQQLGRALCMESEGNPLFLVERFQDLLETNQVQERGGQWLVNHPIRDAIPATLQAMILQRLSRLSKSAYQVAAVGAVVGRSFDVDLLHEVAGLPEYRVQQELDELLDHFIIQDLSDGAHYRYSFSHHLIQEVLYGQMEPETLRARHARAARVIEDLAGDSLEPVAGELARHFDRGGDARKAVHYYLLAARSATALYADEDALESLGRGLQLAPPGAAWREERLALLRQRLRIRGKLMDFTNWLTDIEEIERLSKAVSDPAAQLEALESRMMLASLRSNWDDLVETGSRALAIARQVGYYDEEARIARTLSMQIVAQLGYVRQAIPILQRMVDLGEGKLTTAEYIESLCALSFALQMNLQAGLARRYAEDALTLTKRFPEDISARAFAFAALGGSAWFQAEWETAHAAFQEALGLAFEAQNLKKIYEIGTTYMLFARGAGLANQMRQMIQFGLQQMQNRDLDDSASILAMKSLLAESYIMTGELDEADRLMGLVHAAVSAPPSGRFGVAVYEVLGTLRLAQGRAAEAQAAYAQGLALWKSDFHSILSMLYWHAIAAQRAGDQASAQAIYERAEAIWREADAPRYDALRHLACYEVTGDPQALAAAHQAVTSQAARIQDEEMRRGFLESVLLHREIERFYSAGTLLERSPS